MLIYLNLRQETKVVISETTKIFHEHKVLRYTLFSSIYQGSYLTLPFDTIHF